MKQEYEIKTSNKFDCLEEEKCVIKEVLKVISDVKNKKMIKPLKKDHYKTDQIDIPNFTQNIFQI